MTAIDLPAFLPAPGGLAPGAAGGLVIDDDRTLRHTEFDVHRVVPAVVVVLVRRGDHHVAMGDAIEETPELLRLGRHAQGDGRRRFHMSKRRLYGQGSVRFEGG